MDQTKINNYIEIIDKLGCELSLSDILRTFITSYNGSNQEEFDLLVASAIAAMIKYEQAKIKADGYDSVIGANQDFDEWFSGLRNEYKQLEEGIMPINPPEVSTPPEEEDQE